MENFVFKQLQDQEADSLIRRFFEDDIIHVVWECESSKIPEPNVILFGCIKDFYIELKVRNGIMFGGMGKTLFKT
jgi:hypothetical protein